MIFTWTHIQTKDKYSYEEINIPVGNNICGLQRQGSRPHTVELTYDELKYLLNNPDYAVNTVLLAIYTPRK